MIEQPNGEFPITGDLLIKHSQKEPDKTQVVFVTNVEPPKIEVTYLTRGGPVSWVRVEVIEPGVYARTRGGCRFYDPKLIKPDDLKLKLGFASDIEPEPVLPDPESLRKEKRDRGTRRLSFGDAGR